MVPTRPRRITSPIGTDASTSAAGKVFFSAARNEPPFAGSSHHSRGSARASSGRVRNARSGVTTTFVETRNVVHSNPRNSSDCTNAVSTMTATQKFGMDRQRTPPNDAR